MKYKSKVIKTRANDRAYELARLWIECDVPAEFWIRQSMEIPDATAAELRALKIHWFKTCHLGLYMLCWIIFASLCSTAAVFGILLNSFSISICAGLVYLTVFIGHLVLHEDMMMTIQYYEDKKSD